MTFLWPGTVWFLVVVAALPFVYLWLLRRRSRALMFSNLVLVREAVARRPSLRRHLPPLLLFVAFALMGFALLRPAAIVTLPSERATVVLALDVSRSMRANDVQPNRIAAAQQAARTFIASQPRNVRIGLVVFSGAAMVAQMPTLVREDVLAAVDSLHLQSRTAVGSGIVASLQAIFPEMQSELSFSTLQEPQAARLGERIAPPKTPTRPVPPGSFTSAVIILLSDGRTNAGIDPIEAAQMAADRGVRVFTVGVGDPHGVTSDVDGWMMYMQLDEEALQQIADITHVHYFNAQSGGDLQEIYKTLSAQFISETKRTELTGMIAAPALLLLLLAVVLSLIWSNRVT